MGELCPLLALSGHRLVHCTCPLLGVKQTWAGAVHMSAYDPKRTFGGHLITSGRLYGTVVFLNLRRLTTRS